jgi:hypothetical protein
MWSDNPAFDWQFFNYYAIAYLGKNPFGHSARRIGDFFAGLEADPRASSAWKKLRTERHTHNALDDARGNAGALEAIFQQAQRQHVRNQLAHLAESSYRLGGDENFPIELVCVPQRDGDPRWAIRRGHECFNHQGEWEWEPQPSSRDNAFYARCRWGSAAAAAGHWQKSQTPAAQRKHTR